VIETYRKSMTFISHLLPDASPFRWFFTAPAPCFVPLANNGDSISFATIRIRAHPRKSAANSFACRLPTIQKKRGTGTMNPRRLDFHLMGRQLIWAQ
jgi:hypothetical protein